MDLPNDLAPYRKEAYSYLSSAVKDLVFSGSTYQVFLQAKGEEAWVFLSLTPTGKIEDLFCPLEEEFVANLFKTIAYLWVCKKRQLYHQRYNNSLWNKIAELFFDAFPTQKVPKLPSSTFSFVSPERHCAVEVQCSEKGHFFFEGVLFNRPEESEETSLKFSHIPFPELQAWREGKPSKRMLFELSVWSDFGKRLFFASEIFPNFSLHFAEKKGALPLAATVSFAHCLIHFTFTAEQLEELIPFLRSTKANLQVFDQEHAPIEALVFNPDSATITVQRSRPKQLLATIEQKHFVDTLQEWVFVPPDRFFHKRFFQDTLTSEYSIHQIDHFLSSLTKNEWTLLAIPYQLTPTPLKYSLKFDENWDLHIYPYLETPGDLQQKKAWLFSRWLYIPDKGFYAVCNVQFPRKHTVIFKENVSSFVNEMQYWLSEQEGFETHLASLSTQIGYKVTDEGSLFFHHIVTKKGRGQVCDFGRWTYVEGLGFFHKSQHIISLPVGNTIPITKEQIPHFIEQNREDLFFVKNFFTQNNPLTSLSLDISYSESTIYTAPKMEFAKGTNVSKVQFFGSFVYLPEEGFYKLTPQQLLPEKWQLPKELAPVQWEEFFEQELPFLHPYILSLPVALTKPAKLELAVIDAKQNEDGSLFLFLAYESEFGQVFVKTLIEAIKQRQRYVCSEAGLLDLSAPRFHWLRKMIDRPIEGGILSLSLPEFFHIQAVESLKLRSNDEAVTTLIEQLKEQKVEEYPDLCLLRSKLRPYQLSGFHWLWFLYTQKLSGLLCDEMGLGKTHQAMALIAAAYRNKQKKQQPCQFLIVCPTSVLFHWTEKIEEYLVGIKPFLYHGTFRKASELSGKSIVLTSYGVLRRELEYFKKMSFEVVVYDEIHIAKNHDSRLHRSLRNIKAKTQVGLTGTPMENNLQELKALFDILLPGYMPTKKEFEEIYVKPIEKEKSVEKQSVLTRFISPFLLRRSKKQVLSDLPDKHESIYHTVLTEEQLQLYNSLLNQERSRVLMDFSEGERRGYMQVFALITKLKQICNHPALYYGKWEEYEKYSSGKWELFKELIEEVHESGNKVVVFSQYLGMLSIMRRYCRKKKIGFASIEGKTKNRKEQVKKFQSDPKCRVFIGSLLASGVGIDLTQASYVLHYDRWWNPAKENQATDRVHRIGQSKGVEVYKLITLHTIEERINTILEQKTRLFKGVVDASETSWFRTLKLEEIHALFDDAYLP